ncbi:hypothetical protein CPB86DRAFT_815199 [Serendipita vermifera]|nr:hypothetical protein CPB86DRAFT_815199 [Serendipita vermifera]
MSRCSSGALSKLYILINMLFIFLWLGSIMVVTAQTSTASVSETPTTTVNTSASSPTPGNRTTVDALWDCQPCGQYACSFSANAVLASEIYTVIIAVPIFNCYPNATTIFDWPTEGEANITESWAPINGGIGLNLGMLQLQPSVGWSRSNGINISESVSLHVPPGCISCSYSVQSTQGKYDFLSASNLDHTSS